MKIFNAHNAIVQYTLNELIHLLEEQATRSEIIYHQGDSEKIYDHLTKYHDIQQGRKQLDFSTNEFEEIHWFLNHTGNMNGGLIRSLSIFLLNLCPIIVVFDKFSDIDHGELIKDLTEAACFVDKQSERFGRTMRKKLQYHKGK